MTRLYELADTEDLDFVNGNLYRPVSATYPFGVVVPAGLGGSGVLGAGAPVADVLHAVPFPSARGGMIDRLTANVTAGVAGNARLGIYASTSRQNLYPANLVYASGLLDVTLPVVANSATALRITLKSSFMYWFVWWSEVAPTITTLTTPVPLFGVDAAFAAPQFGVIAASVFTGNPMPTTFPPAGTALLVDVPCIAARFSA